MIALQLTRHISPLAPYAPQEEPMPDLPRLFLAGDRVVIPGNTDHPTMTVAGVQPDLFGGVDGRTVLCTFTDAGGVWRSRWYRAAQLVHISGLGEDA